MCDTFVALNSLTKDASIILAKNSDREPNEAQLLEYFPAQEFNQHDTVKCTYISVPQAPSTQAVLISRPFWMWGAEMGVNSAGVAIGNEAVFTKESMSKDQALLGMDLLRLALERATSAERAVEVITELLAEHGQGGPCGFKDKKLTYHNSFLIADASTAWVLETAGEYWVAKQVTDYYAISNGLTIGEDYDLSHTDVIRHAQKKGWLKKGTNFHFTHCYSDWFYTTFSSSRQRKTCSLNNVKEDFTIADAMIALRDHGEKQYSPSQHVFMNKVCAHSAYPVTRHASQSTGSMIAHLQANDPSAWITGTSAPCTSLFKPVWLSEVRLPESSQHGGGDYSDDSLWWRHERLHRQMLRNFASAMADIEGDRNGIEADWINTAAHVMSEERGALTEYTFQQAEQKQADWLAALKKGKTRRVNNFLYQWYWGRQNKSARMPI